MTEENILQEDTNGGFELMLMIQKKQNKTKKGILYVLIHLLLMSLWHLVCARNIFFATHMSQSPV